MGERATHLKASPKSGDGDRGIDPIRDSIDRERKFSPEKLAQPLESWEPIAGGIIVICLGVLVMMDAFVNLNNDVHDFWMIPFELSFDNFQQIALLSVAGAVLAVLGGEMAVMRISYRIAVVGSIACAVVGWLWYNWFGLALGLAGTMLISVSSEQFERSRNDRQMENLILGTEEIE